VRWRPRRKVHAVHEQMHRVHQKPVRAVGQKVTHGSVQLNQFIEVWLVIDSITSRACVTLGLLT
jgi:hypothetical protein